MKVYLLTGNSSFVGREEDTPVLGIFSSQQLAEDAALLEEANSGVWHQDEVPTSYKHLEGYRITELEVDGGMIGCTIVDGPMRSVHHTRSVVDLVG